MAGKRRGTTWALDRHTEAKHRILRSYLDAWIPIMASRHTRIVYIDGFAGPGEYLGGEDGSPVIAIKALAEHSHRKRIRATILYVFIEKRADRCDHLKAVLGRQEVPDRAEYRLLNAPFDEQLSEVLNYIDEQKTNLAPTFAFIDPFGVSDTPLSLVDRLMAQGYCEVLITFQHEAITRFLSTSEFRRHLDVLYGTGEWRQAETLSGSDRTEFLRQLYVSQLRVEAGVNYVHSFEMIDSGNRTEYFLIFGTNHLRGLEKMKDAMWRVDPAGGIQFSDYTNPNQPYLIGREPDLALLARQVRDRFACTEASIEGITEFVLAETAFRKGHLRVGVLVPLEKAGKLEVLTPRSRKMSYPKGTRLHLS